MHDQPTLTVSSGPADDASACGSSPIAARSPTAIDVRDVTAHYGQFEILSNVGFPVAEGTIHGLIGPNGAGKSTLLDVITGSHRPTRGSVQFDGQDISRNSPHVVARMGVRRTFQHPRLCWNWTLIENVIMGLTTSDERISERTARAHAALIKVGVGDKALVRADQTDGVTQLRTQIARCLVATPRVLILDEPSAGMDQKQRNELANLLLELKESGTTVLLVAHDLPLIRACTEGVTVINAGHLIAHATAEAVLNDEGVRAAYLGATGDV